MAAARRRPSEESLEDRIGRIARDRDASGADLFDVPAAVICAYCNEPDCAGCEAEQGERSRSGVVAIIPWERPTLPVFARLWSTARSTTREGEAEGFFELLPDGPLLPAFRFAAACELLAVTSFFLAFTAVAAVIAPEWLLHVALDPVARGATLRGLVLGLPAFAGLLVAAHAAHGLSIDLGARRVGARGARTRALRFGLYACGWDLVMGPFGAVVVAIQEGLAVSAGLLSSLSGLPTRATTAFVRGCYRLDGDRQRRALATSYVGATIATLVFAFLILLAIVAAVFL